MKIGPRQGGFGVYKSCARPRNASQPGPALLVDRIDDDPRLTSVGKIDACPIGNPIGRNPSYLQRSPIIRFRPLEPMHVNPDVAPPSKMEEYLFVRIQERLNDVGDRWTAGQTIFLRHNTSSDVDGPL